MNNKLVIFYLHYNILILYKINYLISILRKKIVLFRKKKNFGFLRNILFKNYSFFSNSWLKHGFTAFLILQDEKWEMLYINLQLVMVINN